MALNFRSSVKYRNAYGGQTYSLAALSEITDSNGASNTVVDNDPAGTAVGITALATMTGYTVTYSLTNSAGGKYTINETTGVVYVGLVALAAGTDSITVQATANGQVKTKTFSITVTASGAYIPNLWVDGATGNDSYTRAQIIAGAGTLKWQTLGRAMWGGTTLAGINASEAAQAGDVVAVAGGTYHSSESIPGAERLYTAIFRPVNSGTAGNPIVFIATGNVYITTDTGQQPPFGVNAQNYITFTYEGSYRWNIDEANNVTYTAENGPCVLRGADNIILEGFNLTGDDLKTTGNHAGIYAQDCNNCEVRNSHITNFTVDDGGGTNAACILTYDCNNWIVENNELDDGTQGIFIKGIHSGYTQMGWTIRYNYIHDCTWDGVTVGGHGYYPGEPVTVTDTNIYQNLITNCPLVGGILFKPFDAVTPTGVNSYNNTIINCGNSADNGYGGAHVLWLTWTIGTGIEIYNTLTSGCKAAIATSNNNPSTIGMISDYNMHYNNTQFGGYNDTNYTQANWITLVSGNEIEITGITVGTNPNFVATGAAPEYYKLQGGSAALTAGRTSGVVGCYITGTEQIGAV